MTNAPVPFVGLIEIQEPKRGVQSLAKVNRAHQLYFDFDVGDNARAEGSTCGFRDCAACGCR